MSEVERSAWILMERIFPPISKGYMIRPNGPSPPPLVDLVSELGIFGAVIGYVEYFLQLEIATLKFQSIVELDSQSICCS